MSHNQIEEASVRLEADTPASVSPVILDDADYDAWLSAASEASMS